MWDKQKHADEVRQTIAFKDRKLNALDKYAEHYAKMQRAVELQAEAASEGEFMRLNDIIQAERWKAHLVRTWLIEN